MEIFVEKSDTLTVFRWFLSRSAAAWCPLPHFSWLIPLPSSILNPSDTDCSASRWSCPCVSSSSRPCKPAPCTLKKQGVLFSDDLFGSHVSPWLPATWAELLFPSGALQSLLKCPDTLCRQIWVPTRLTWRYSPFPHSWESIGGKWCKERGKMSEKIPQLPVFIFLCSPPTLLFPHGAGTTLSSGVVLWRHEEDIDVLALSTSPISHHSG